MAQGKKYKDAARSYDREGMHSIEDATQVLSAFPKR